MALTIKTFPNIDLKDEIQKTYEITSEKMLEVFENCDPESTESIKETRAKLNGIKGGGSRKIQQLHKIAFIECLFECNPNFPKSYTAYNQACKAFFNESLDKSKLSEFKKKLKYGNRQVSMISFEEETFLKAQNYILMKLQLEKEAFIQAFQYTIEKGLIAHSIPEPKKVVKV